MNPKEIRREKIHQRIHILRIRYDRCIIFSLILLSVGLAVCMGINVSRDAFIWCTCCC